jgi:hypothetical protein
MADTKADIINDAYEEMRISGLTTQPGPEDVRFALRKLEGMMGEWFQKNINVNYNFTASPDPADLTNIDLGHRESVVLSLATRMLAAFGKPANPEMMRAKRAAFSSMMASTRNLQQIDPPSRQPLGSGNTNRYGNDWNRFYSGGSNAPQSAATNEMLIGDVNDFKESFESYLADGETIASFTIEADTGLTINSSTNNDPVIDYQIEATGTNNTSSVNNLQVKIQITTDAGRKETRIIYFVLQTADVID